MKNLIQKSVLFIFVLLLSASANTAFGQVRDVNTKIAGTAWKFDRVMNYDYPTITEKNAEAMNAMFDGAVVIFGDKTSKLGNKTSKSLFMLNFNNTEVVLGSYTYLKTKLKINYDEPASTAPTPRLNFMKDYTYSIATLGEGDTDIVIKFWHASQLAKPTYQLVFKKN